MKQQCHPEHSRGIRLSSIRSLHFARLCLATVGMTLLLTGAVNAEEAKTEAAVEKPAEEAKKDPDDKSVRFAPDFCDFEITFPEAPAIAKKCVAENQCYDINSYTMVYDLQTTVDVSVSCNPSTPEAYKHYNQAVMKAALAGMIEERNLTSHDMKFNDMKTTKNAAITGVGTTGAQDKIYSGQLWVGPNSVFTVQAELVGAAHPVGDKSFRDILASIKVKDGKQLPKPKEYKVKSN